MTAQSTDPYTYRVYLREEPPSPSLSSPLLTRLIDYYDSGIWIHRDDGRVFVPYHQIQLIEEVEGTEAEAAAAESGTTEATPEDEGGRTE